MDKKDINRLFDVHKMYKLTLTNGTIEYLEPDKWIPIKIASLLYAESRRNASSSGNYGMTVSEVQSTAHKLGLKEEVVVTMYNVAMGEILNQEPEFGVEEIRLEKVSDNLFEEAQKNIEDISGDAITDFFGGGYKIVKK